jgi:hypothetical protein
MIFYEREIVRFIGDDASKPLVVSAGDVPPDLRRIEYVRKVHVRIDRATVAYAKYVFGRVRGNREFVIKPVPGSHCSEYLKTPTNSGKYDSFDLELGFNSAVPFSVVVINIVIERIKKDKAVGGSGAPILHYKKLSKSNMFVANAHYVSKAFVRHSFELSMFFSYNYVISVCVTPGPDTELRSAVVDFNCGYATLVPGVVRTFTKSDYYYNCWNGNVEYRFVGEIGNVGRCHPCYDIDVVCAFIST